MFCALFICVISMLFTGAYARAPENGTLLPETIFVTMVAPAPPIAKEAPAPEAPRACRFAAEQLRNLGYIVSEHCGSTALSKPPLLKTNDTLVVLVFTDEPVNALALDAALPMQVVGSGNRNTLLVTSMPFVHASGALANGESEIFSAEMVMPGGSGLLARTVSRCIYENKDGLTFEETTSCWSQLYHEVQGGEDYASIMGEWDAVLNARKLIYPPRVAPTADTTSKAAKALLAFDRKTLASETLLRHDGRSMETPITPTKQLAPWSTKKIVLTTLGGTAAVTTAFSLVGVYTEASALVNNAAAGKYGAVGDPRLTEAVDAYNRLGSTVPWLWAGVGVGCGVLGVGIALPNTNEVTIAPSPTGLSVSGTF